MYLALGIPAEESFERERRERSTQHIARFSQAFRELYPGAAIQLVAFPEAELIAQLPRRQQAGLGPDLLLITAAAALQLQREGQVRALSPSAETLNEIEPEALARLRLADGRLAALPVTQEPELACFNRKQLPEGSPRDLDTLLQRSSAVNTAVWQAFRHQGIEIPFPQRVQYSISGPPDDAGAGAPGPG